MMVSSTLSAEQSRLRDGLGTTQVITSKQTCHRLPAGGMLPRLGSWRGWDGAGLGAPLTAGVPEPPSVGNRISRRACRSAGSRRRDASSVPGAGTRFWDHFRDDHSLPPPRLHDRAVLRYGGQGQEGSGGERRAPRSAGTSGRWGRGRRARAALPLACPPSLRPARRSRGGGPAPPGTRRSQGLVPSVQAQRSHHPVKLFGSRRWWSGCCGLTCPVSPPTEIRFWRL